MAAAAAAATAAAAVIATYVKAGEADAFTLVLQTLVLRLEGQNERVLALVAQVVAATLGREARVTVAGSVAKGTEVGTSDLDLLVETQEPVTLSQRKALEVRLQSHPELNAAHVKLKKLAIHARVFGLDVDIVCANTAEYGVRPPPDSRFVSADAAVKLAARALKLWSRHAGSLASRKVPGHALESLALYCRPLLRAAAVGDCSMQLFVDVLQRIVGCGAELRTATRLDAATQGTLCQRAMATLHVFVVSRVLLPGGSFRTAAEVQAWLSGVPGVRPPCDTPAGAVPCWLLQSPATQQATDMNFEQFEGDSLAALDGAELTEEEARTHSAVRLMLSSPLGAFTTVGASRLDNPSRGGRDVAAEMEKLAMHAARGSAVARRMILARQLWLDAEAAMCCVPPDAAHAVEFFAAALRASVADGDPFSGWVIRGTAAYSACADSVLATCPDDEDALLLRAWALHRDGRWADAEAVHTTVLERRAPDDAYGALYHRFILRGNQGRWRDALEDAERCAELCPEEPMFYYWIAVARRNLLGAGNEHYAEICAMYRRFLALASPEGRKVAPAHYDLAMLDARGSVECADKPALLARLRASMREAQEAEARQLPVFPRVDCDAKELVLTLLRTLEQPTAAAAVAALTRGPSDPALLRKEGNAAFASRQFAKAEDAYSRALRASPGSAELHANRAAARTALHWFTAAAEDAAAAAAACPGWAKPHYRAAQAHMGRMDGAAALAAARRAAELRPGDDDVARVLAEAMRLAELQSSVTPPPDARCQPHVWERVAFKENVHAVSPSGGASFACITDALHQLRGSAGGLTLILLPGVHVESALFITPGEPVQLLGWADPGSGSAVSELRLSANEHIEHFTLLTAIGPEDIVPEIDEEGNVCPVVPCGEVTLEWLRLVQPVGLPQTSGGHCARCTGGATLHVIACRAFSPDSPCFNANGSGSRLTLSNVVVKRASAAVVVHGGLLHADECTFAGCARPAVETREGGEAVLRGCTFTKCTSQAAIIYQGGRRLELHSCTVRQCGSLRLPAVQMDEGVSLLRNCTIEDNPANAIIVQGNVMPHALTEPVALLDNCRMERNNCGLCIFYGSAVVSGCTFTANAQLGCVVHGVPPHKLVVLRGSTFAHNGSRAFPADLSVMGQRLFELCVRLEANNVLSTPPRVVSDAQAADILDEVKALVQSHGHVPSPDVRTIDGTVSDRAGWMMPRKQAVQEHMRKLRALQRATHRADYRDECFGDARKPLSLAVPPLLASLQSVTVAELQPGHTHRGRVLRGKLIVPPLALRGLTTLLEDDAGAVLKLVVYNLLPSGGNQSAAQRERTAARVLPNHTRIAVLEPLFKLLADGTYGVRVDDPRELVLAAAAGR